MGEGVDVVAVVGGQFCLECLVMAGEPGVIALNGVESIGDVGGRPEAEVAGYFFEPQGYGREPRVVACS